MTKTRNTKRALLMSALSLLMCVSMLIGSTFAWFTDSVTSSGNKIVAGTLDVQLLMNTGDGYKDISDNANPIFGEGSIAQNNNAETLWEPGKTQVAYLAIKNNGSLALKYTVGLDVQNVSKDLYKVMQYAITPDAQYNSVTDWSGYGNNVVVGTQSVSESVSLGVGETHYFALSIHMDEAAGNEYQGGEVNFDLTVLATQNTVESDSFNNQYDANADYDGEISNVTSLAAAFANGGTYKVTADITVDDVVVIPEGKEVVLDLNGKTLSKSEDNGIVVRNYGKLTLSGNGTIDGTIGNYAVRTEPGSELTINEGIVVDGGFGAVSCFGGKLTINGGDFSNEESNTTHYVVYATNNSTVVINGGTFTFGEDQYAGSNGSPILAATNGTTIEINGGSFDATGGSALCYNANNVVIKGGTFKNRATVTYGGTIETKVADGYKVTETNGTYVVSVDKDNVCTADSFADALAEGGNVKVTADITVDDVVVIPEGKEVVLDLNGKTLSKSEDNGIVVRNYGKLTLSGNGTIDGTIGNYAVRTEPGSELTINEGIVVDGGFGAVSCFGGKLTINGGDFSNEESNTTHYVVYATNNSTVVINGGTFTFGEDQYAGSNGSPILAATNGTTIEINGGSFDATGGSALCYNANNVVIKGGTFKNRATITYGGTIETKVADGYAVTKNDSVWTVAAN